MSASTSKQQQSSSPAAGSTKFVASNWKVVAKNTLAGTVDLETPSGYVFRGLMLHEREGNEGKKRWVQIPSREFKKEDGTRSFFPVIQFATPEKWWAFNSAALAAIDTLLQQGGER